MQRRGLDEQDLDGKCGRRVYMDRASFYVVIRRYVESSRQGFILVGGGRVSTVYVGMRVPCDNMIMSAYINP